MSLQLVRSKRRLSARVKYLLTAIALTGLAAPVIGQAQSLTSLKLAAKGEHAEVVVMRFSGPAPRPAIFSVSSPPQLTIDLPGVSNTLADSNRELQDGLVRSVETGTVDDGVRVVLMLAKSVPYHVERSGNRLKLVLNATPEQPTLHGGPEVTRLEPDSTPDTKQTDSGGFTQPARANTRTRESMAASSARRVTRIDFRRGKNGAGRVVLKLSRGDAPLNVQRSGDKVIARISNTELPNRFEKYLDVRDFGSIVNSIQVSSRDGDVRLAIKPRQGANFTQLAYETARQATIALRPLESAEKNGDKASKPRFTGEEISLSFQDVQVRKLLQLIASVADVNLVASGQVDGTMSLRLQNVPWDQALHIILRAQGLGKRRNGNVISIAPLPVLAARGKARQAAQEASQNLKPLRTQIIALNYADAGDIKGLIKVKDGGANALLSDRGVIRVDERTNSLIISDTQSHLDAIQRLVDKLDRARDQVLIQSRIVVANRNFQRQLGAKFGIMTANKSSGTGPGGAGQVKSGGFSVSLPVGSPTGTLFTSIITSDLNIGLVLQAMQSENRGKVVSAPRVITLAGQKAVITRGTQIPYVSSTGGSRSGTTVEFKEAELSLGVTPRITPDNHVLLKLNIQKDKVGDTVPTASGGREPSINTNQLKTAVLVNNGDTVVLGGIYKHINKRIVSSVPFISEIPLIGRLFKNTDRTNKRSQILIFITPRILKSQIRATASN